MLCFMLSLGIQLLLFRLMVLFLCDFDLRRERVKSVTKYGKRVKVLLFSLQMKETMTK